MIYRKGEDKAFDRCTYYECITDISPFINFKGTYYSNFPYLFEYGKLL